MDELSQADYEKLLRAIEANRRVFAVKIYKDATGVTLREAKSKVEDLTAELRTENPETFEAHVREPDPMNIDGVLESIFNGKKIEAVKCYKEANKCSLKEAKEFIEELTEKLHQDSPEQFKAPSGAGCSLLLIGIGITAAFILSVG